jgi:uncharacterized OB-fold protein
MIMNCKNCGKPLAPDVKFCGFCGTVVESKKEDIDALTQGLLSAVEDINRGVRT